AAEFSPDGRFVLTASRDGSAQVWDARAGARAGKALRHVDDRPAHLPALGTAVLLSGGDDPPPPPRGVRAAPPPRHADARIEWAGFSPDGRHVMAVSDDPKHWCRVWEAETGKPVTDYLPPPGSDDGSLPVYGTACFHPRGGVVALAARNLVQLWSIETGK